MENLNKLVDNIYILYIKDAEIVNINETLDTNVHIEYFKGFDGTALTNADIPNKLRKGEYGHINSFILILEDAIKKKYNKILILEPDVYFSSNMEKLEPFLLLEYKLLYLGATQYKYYSEYTWPKINILNGYYNAYKTLGTFAISISSSIFQELIDVFKTFKSPTDVMLTDIQSKYNNQCYVVYPNLICCNVIGSTTNPKTSRNQVKFMELTKWIMGKYNFVNVYKYAVKEGLYEVTFIINSKLSKHSICLGGELLIDDLSVIIKSDVKTGYRQIANNRKDNCSAYKIYFMCSGNNLHIKTENMFINSIGLKLVTVEYAKSMLNVNYVSRINLELPKYYKRVFFGN
jgi:GR25 family glycosyltransferase involved in LPS biosynthesis